MTQDERWLKRYTEVKDFIESNYRNPSRRRIEEYLMLNFLKHNRKLECWELKEERREFFLILLELGEKYRRENQYL